MNVRRSIAAAMVVAVAALASQMGPAGGAGPALYPDLVTLQPDNLSFDVVTLADGRAHNVIRFDNGVANTGPGRLELEGKKRSKIYQRVYDAPQGGTLVQNTFLGNDGVFHRGHNHYHIENFASYVLLRRDPGTGAYGEISRGTKTSFCIIDVRRVSGSDSAQYTGCGRTLQGLTVGWSDIHGAYLADQWIDLGVAAGGPALADGEYKVQSTANPGIGGSPRIIETNYANNTNERSFSVVAGRIVVN